MTAIFEFSPRAERLRNELQRCASESASADDRSRGVAPDHAGSVGAEFAHTMAWYDLTRVPGALRRLTDAALQAGLGGDRAAPGAAALSEISAPLSEFMRERYAFCADVPALVLPTGYSPGATRIFRRASR